MDSLITKQKQYFSTPLGTMNKTQIDIEQDFDSLFEEISTQSSLSTTSLIEQHNTGTPNIIINELESVPYYIFKIQKEKKKNWRSKFIWL